MCPTRQDPNPSTPAEAEALDELLVFLKGTRGFDFTGYKRTSLERRIRKRMDAVDVSSYGQYLDFLQVHPEEYGDLFNTILINVTDFFRDKPAWDHLAAEVLPKLIHERPPDQPLRVWCAACASGQESYTTAMLLAELMGESALRDRVKIYATDVDQEALNEARLSQYSNDQVKHVPRELLDKYFEQNDHRYTVRPELRHAVIFGRNDLVQDAPISRVDLLVCRNTLMYFNAETQSRILGHFNFALTQSGVLFLGKSEMLITHADLFSPISLKWRVFRKVAQPTLRERIGMIVPGTPRDQLPERYLGLREGALEIGRVAEIVLDRGGFVASVNQEARALFGITARDIGRPLQDLEISYRPVELRSLLERAYEQERAVVASEIQFRNPGGEERSLEVSVTPVISAERAVLGASVSFEDVTRHVRMKADLERSKRELETAYEELQSTVEELETTNEELQSTNEELETTNEELQSTNEELETMNEELQSSNEELETMNDELRDRTSEINRVNTFLEAILSSLHVGVTVLDPEQRVQIWNAASEDMWGLRSEEVEGAHFLNLDIGLPVEELRQPLKAALAGEPGDGAVSVEAINRRGRPIIVDVSATPLLAEDGSIYGTILLMAEKRRAVS
ncbi:MAG TPA: CheR family methyltransferase [Thermoleophilaceae bacterium]